MAHETTMGESREMPEMQLTDVTVVELDLLRREPARHDWFPFKPGIKKAILSGTPNSRHVSLLWYFEERPGAVALHHHEKTESIFVIDGAQTDAKGKYERGSFSFNPPASGHQISESSGLFLLAYAAPPDFLRPTEIAPYENVTVGPDYAALPLSPWGDGSLRYRVPLVQGGGMSGCFVKLEQGAELTLTSNLLLVLQGRCSVSGQYFAKDTLLVGKGEEAAPYHVATLDERCLLYAMAFQ